MGQQSPWVLRGPTQSTEEKGGRWSPHRVLSSAPLSLKPHAMGSQSALGLLSETQFSSHCLTNIPHCYGHLHFVPLTMLSWVVGVP